MWMSLVSLATNIKTKVLLWGSAVLIVLTLIASAYFKGKKAKANEVKAKTADTIIETVKKERVIEKSIDDLSADERRERLRKYVRNPK